MTPGIKKTIDLTAPTLVAALVGWYLLKRIKDWRILAGIVGGVWVLTYFITRSITKAARDKGPAPVPTGGGCEAYDPKGLVDSLYSDINEVFGLRNNSLYATLAGLSDCQLIKAYNYWNETYYPEVQQTLPIAIADEVANSVWNPEFKGQREAVLNKFKTLNLQ